MSVFLSADPFGPFVAAFVAAFVGTLIDALVSAFVGNYADVFVGALVGVKLISVDGGFIFGYRFGDIGYMITA